MPNVIMGDVPAWYDLRTNGRALVIEVHPQVLDQAVEWANKTGADSVAVRSERGGEPMPLPHFIPYRQGIRRWSFGSAVETVQSVNPGWTAWLVPLPYKTSQWQKGYVISAALENIFRVLQVVGANTRSERQQLLVISAMTVWMGTYGGAISAQVSPQLGRWIERWWSQREMVIRIAMRQAWSYMYKRGVLHNLDNFRTMFNPPRFIHLDVPGDSVGLDPSDMYGGLGRREGYELAPHNTDHPGQQLALLVGLAKIYQLAREDGF